MADLSSYVDRVRVTLKHASTYKRPSYSVLREMARQNASLIAPQTMVGHSTKNLLVGLDAIKPIKLDPTAQKKLFSTNPADTAKTSGLRTQELKNALKELVTTSPSKEHIDAWSRHSALNLGQVREHLAKVVGGRNRGLKQSRGEELKDALNSLIYSALPPTHHAAKEMASMLPHSHRSWYRFGKGGPNPGDTVKASEYAADLLKVSKIEKRNGKYVLKTKDGKKTLGTHASKERAMAQETAINISKAKRK